MNTFYHFEALEERPQEELLLRRMEEALCFGDLLLIEAHHQHLERLITTEDERCLAAARASHVLAEWREAIGANDQHHYRLSAIECCPEDVSLYPKLLWKAYGAASREHCDAAKEHVFAAIRLFCGRLEVGLFDKANDPDRMIMRLFRILEKEA